MQRSGLGTGRDAELGAQQVAQLLVDAQRFGRVALLRERLDQQPVGALAVRRQTCELTPARSAAGSSVPPRRRQAAP